QSNGLVRVAVSPQLLRLRNDVSRFRRLEPERIPQRVDRVRETAEPEEQVRPLVCRLSVSSVYIEDVRITLERRPRAAEEDQELGSIEPDARLLRPGPEQAVVALQGRIVVALRDECLGFFPEAGRSSFVFELT